MHLLPLKSVDGFVAFDLEDCWVNSGGTRFAPDVTPREAELLARAMTYKMAVLHQTIGGAKGVVRGSADRHAELMRRYCEEIRSLYETGRFLTGPDLGTSQSDFTHLLPRGADAGVMSQLVDGVAFEDVLTGFGVVVAAERALGSLEGRSVAIEGFGKVGGGVAREAVRRGAKVVAVSTLSGCVARADGLDVEQLWRLREFHGDDFVHHLGLEARPPADLFDVPADVLVPGARPGAIDLQRARRLSAKAVVPAGNVPYRAGVPDALQERDIPALADFVCNAGGVLGHLAPPTSEPDAVLADLERRVRDLVNEASDHPRGPFAGACWMAEEFLRTWREPAGMPDGPPLA